MNIQEKIDNAAFQILKGALGGLRFTDLWHRAHDALPDVSENHRSRDVTRWVSRTTTRYCLDPDTPC